MSILIKKIYQKCLWSIDLIRNFTKIAGVIQFSSVAQLCLIEKEKETVQKIR